jgi:tetratricopeptide (TPR) repeat protein
MLPAEINQQLQALAQQNDVARLLPLLHDLAPRYPDDPEIRHLLGWCSMRQRRLDEAISYFREAIRLNPNAVPSLNYLGLVLLEQERLAEALDTFKAAVAADPTHIPALTNLSLTLCRVGFWDKAVLFLQEALRLNPQYADAHHYLGYAYLMLNRVDDADRHVAMALTLKPGTAGFLSTLGLIREKQRRPQEATQLFQQAVDADPELAEPWSNLGTIHAAVWGNYDLALRCFNQTLAIKPMYTTARYHRGIVELTLGDYERGWADYEFRPTVFQKSPARYSRARWQGEPLAGKAILLHCEQGLGDTLQFIRYAERAKRLGASVLCEVQKPLLRLLANTPGIDALVPEGDPLPPHDYQIPLLSIGQVLGIFPGQPPYLFPSQERLEFWEPRIRPIAGFKIGIAWQGEPGFKYDWLRSVPLAQFEKFARLSGVSLISLQKIHGLDQIAANQENVPLIVPDPAIDESAGPFMDTAAIMKHLDLVITSDSAVAHLAGGLGVPVWLATMYAPDWRWLTRREDSPWYPTMRLFRQSKPGHWDNVFTRMATELASKLL